MFTSFKRLLILPISVLICMPLAASAYNSPPLKTQIATIDQLIVENHYHEALIKSNDVLTQLGTGGYNQEEYGRWMEIVSEKVMLISKLSEVSSRSNSN